MKSEFVALIPAYKPEDKLIKLIDELKCSKFKIVVINDGSGAEFNNIFDVIRNDCVVINHDINKGKGAALKTGLKYIKDNFSNKSIIVTMDADGQHTVSDALRLIAEVQKYNHEKVLICGSRKQSSSSPLRSRIGNGITRFIYKLVTGNQVYDTQTGLRAFNYDLISYMLEIDGDRYEYEINVLLNTGANNISIHEINIETIYIDNNSSSHFNPIKDSFKIYMQIIKFVGSSLICFGIDYMLYIVFNIILNNVIYSNILARIFSSISNFLINKKLVFKNDEKSLKIAVKYFLLVILILCANTLLLNVLVNYISINKYVAKIIVEMFLFVISYFVQKKMIFHTHR